ncbi:MAG: undecaprenyl-diphosphatase [Massilia sp.]
MLMIALWLLGGQMRRKQVLHMFLMTLLALGLNQLAALAWPHPRPFMVALGHTFIAHADDSSFPSDHMTVFACVGLRLLLDRAYRLAAGVLAAGCAVAWARVFLGVHFPFDMIGALMVAAVACLLMWPLWRRVGDTVTALGEQLYRRLFSWPIAAGMLRH